MKVQTRLTRYDPGSLNIFTGKFGMKADLTRSEPRQLDKWDKSRVFYHIRRCRRTRKKFTLHDGPPYANGKVHAGHAVNKILKDIITKHKNLSGCDAPLMLGWDCHGMPVEVQVRKDTSHGHCSGLRLLEKSRAYVNHQITGQFADFRRLGIMIQRKETYLTMSKMMEAEEVRVFQLLLVKGLARRGVKPLYWCFSCKSSLADAEVESQLTLKTGGYVVFPFYKSYGSYERAKRLLGVNLVGLLGGISVWTTTPWTVTANKAISINPNDNYVAITSGGEWSVCSEGSVGNFVLGIQKTMVVCGIFGGIGISKLKFQHPLSDLLGKYSVSLKPMLDPAIRISGTGVVHIAPAHGVDDFNQLRQNQQISSLNSITSTGIHKSVLLRRKSLGIANVAILAWISFTGNLEGCKMSLSLVAQCSRHKVSVIVRVLGQWFINTKPRCQTLPTKEKILKYFEDSDFVPEDGKQHLLKVIQAKPDWCLSRQREWGVPIVVFTTKNNNSLHPFGDEMIRTLSDEMETLGIETWVGVKLLSFKRKCSTEFTKSSDTLDVWFDSGTTWNALRRNCLLSFPADFYLEGPDQYRGWFYSSLVVSVLLTGISPSRSFVTHGFVVNNKGEKLSKSVGNCGNLVNLLERNGAEVLRLLVSSADYHKEMQITDQSLRSVGDNYRKIRNTLKFVLSNLVDFKGPEDFLPVGCLVEVDIFTLLKTKMTQTELRQQLDLCNFREVVKRTVKFCAGDLGKFYFEIAKDRLYTSNQKSSERKSAQNTLYYIANFLIKGIAPFLSFTSEEAWSIFQPDKNSVFKEYYHSIPAFNWELVTRWNTLKDIRDCNAKVTGVSMEHKTTGSSSDTRVVVLVRIPEYKRLLILGAELKSVFSSSDTRLFLVNDIQTRFMRMIGVSYDKCSRCWLRSLGFSGWDAQVVCVRCKSSSQRKLGDRRLA